VTVAAAVLAATAILLRWPSGRWFVRRRLGLEPAGLTGRWLAAPVAAAVAAGLPRLPQVSGPGVVLTVTAGAATWFCVRHVRRLRHRQGVTRRRGEAIELLGLMAAELTAGVLPQRMLAGLAGDFSVVLPAARAAELGGDVAGALREASAVPGRELLRDLAGAWQVADRSGAPLATVIARLEQAARADREVAREIESAVAPARATGRLMAVLPAMGLMLGSGMGGDPVAVLMSTWVGVACLAAGCALACSGVAWIERIAASAGDA